MFKAFSLFLAGLNSPTSFMFMTLHTLITYSWDIIAFNYVAFSTGVDSPVVIIKWTALHSFIVNSFSLPPKRKKDRNSCEQGR